MASILKIVTVQDSITNLPVQLTSFVGRTREIAEVKRLLAATRLLTLTGSGGAGKTRLALQVAVNFLSDPSARSGQVFSDGIWLVELAPLTDPALVPQTVTSVFDLHVTERFRLIEVLTNHLRSKNLLLLLDNCEHLIEACAQLTDVLLHACPNVRILATSREALNVAGETVFRVPSLTVPDPDQRLALGTLAQIESIRLFSERASASRPEFQLTDANALFVAQICQRLDGMPLAIELAAARVRTLSVEQIAARLNNRFGLLIGGSRTALPRQQTLRATIDWSYDLLPEAERQLFRRLSVFAGGWTLEAAEEVCAGAGIEAGAVLELQSRLIDKSLVIVEEQKNDVRYRFLETLRQYAREKLKESGETQQWQARQLTYCLKLAGEAEPNLRTAAQLQWLNHLEVEHDNLRAALAFALESNRVAYALRLATAVWRFWNMHGHWTEGRQWLTRALAQSTERDLIRARALYALGMLCWFNEDLLTARPFIEESLALARELGDKRRVAEALVALGACYGRSGIPHFDQELFAKGRRIHEESLALWRELGDHWGIAESLLHLGFAHRDLGDPVTAHALLKESLAHWRELGDQWGIAWTLNGLALTAQIQGDYRQASDYFAESNTVAGHIGEYRLRRMSYYCLVEMAKAQGDYVLGRSWAERQLHWAQSVGDSRGTLSAWSELGEAAYLQGDYTRALVDWNEGLTVARAHKDHLRTVYFLTYLGYAWQALDKQQRALELFKESLNLDVERSNTLHMARNFAALGGIAVTQGQGELAVRLFGFAETCAASTRLPLWDRNKRNPYESIVVFERDLYDRDIAALRAKMSEIEFARLWTEGCALTLNQALAEIEKMTITPSLKPVAVAHPHGLTAREIDVLRLLAKGLSNQQIADQLVLSKRTVHAHLRSIYDKLNVTTRSAATRVAFDQKII